ncbi:unnamed protein product, partial [Ixodes hexagonus]
MGRKCFVPNCNSGYQTCKEKVTLFSAPSDPERLVQWTHAIPRKDRPLTSKDTVCAKHFAEDMVLRTRYYDELGGEVLLDSPKRTVILPHAVPCIFPSCLPYLSSAPKKRKSPIKRQSPALPAQKNAQGNNSTVDMASSEAAPGFTTAAQSCRASCDSSTVMEQQGSSTTTGDCLDPADVVLPTTAWGHHRVPSGDLRDFSFTEVRLSPGTPPCSAKILHLEDKTKGKFQVMAFAFDTKVELASLPNTCELKITEDWAVVSEAHESFHKVNLCAGGPAQSKFPSVHPECAYVDKNGVWRQKRCTLVEQERKQCNSCASLNNTLRIHQTRLEKRRTELRLRIPLSPSKKMKVVQPRKQRIACYRSKLRLLKSKQKLEAQLTACQNERKLLEEGGLKEALERTNLPNAQQMLIMECVSAAKTKSKKGIRYTDNWLLLCLLLYIRTPAGYRLLRDNDILPLPAVETVRRYIAMVGLKCGFDADFF